MKLTLTKIQNKIREEGLTHSGLFKNNNKFD